MSVSENPSRDPHDGDYYTQQDLQAQNEMAAASIGMVWLGFGQIILTSISIGLIWMTFRESKRASDSAETMAKQGDLTTKAMKAALVADKRPWLEPSPLKVKAITWHARFCQVLVEPQFNNTGSSPAFFSSVQAFSDWRYDGDVPDLGNFVRAAKAIRGGRGEIVFPGGNTARRQIGVQTQRAEVDELSAAAFAQRPSSGGGLTLWVVIVATYSCDYCEEIHHTALAYLVYPLDDVLIPTTGKAFQENELRVVSQGIGGQEAT